MKGRTREEEVASDGNNIFVPLGAQFNTPQREAKRRKLQAHNAGCQARYLQLYPDAGFCFASTGKTAR